MNGTLLKRVTTLLTVALLGVACASSNPSNTAEPSNGGQTKTSIDVTEHEWEIVLSENSVPAGDVTFNITNEGEEMHEFVVFRTDLDPGSLPTTNDGGVDEEGPGIAHIDEVEDVKPGTSQQLEVTLDPGNYVVLCNIVEMHHVHYEMGMRQALTVTSD